MKTSNDRGSIMVIVMVMVGVLLASGFVVMSQVQTQIQSKNDDSLALEMSSVTGTVATILSKPEVCTGGFDGGGGEAGLQFLDSSGKASSFNVSVASSAAGQNISLPGVYSTSQAGGSGRSTSRQRFEAGTVIPGTNLSLSRLYIANAQAVAGSAGAYKVRVMAQFSDGKTAPKWVTDVLLTVQNGQLSDCQLSPSPSNNRALCESLGCTYTDPQPGEKGNCFCSVKPMKCADGHWVTGVDGSGNMICSESALEKSCPNVDSFMAGLDDQGNPICVTVAIATTTTTTVTTNTTTTLPTFMCASWAQASCSQAEIDRTPVGQVTNNSGVLSAAPQSAIDDCVAKSGSCLQAEMVLDRFGGTTNVYKLFCHKGAATAPYLTVNKSGTFACPGSGPVTTTTLPSAPVAGACGPFDPINPTFNDVSFKCSSGKVINSDSSCGVFTWTCEGISGGGDVKCSAGVHFAGCKK